MPGRIAGLSGGLHEQALSELRCDLKRFRASGLRALRRDLVADRVARGGWWGCPLSYRGGARGTSHGDHRGRPRNTFTRLWDAGWLLATEVAVEVSRELGRRARRLTVASGGR